MIGEITDAHHDQILRINDHFVHWLSPLDPDDLKRLLAQASYARQIDDAKGVLIGYAHDVDDDHKNLRWLRARFDDFYYIDRVIIDAAAHGQGYGKLLYKDFERDARARGHSRLVCEVNTKPDNPGSHAFHLRMGFNAIGEENYPDYEAAVRYYEKQLT